MADLESLYMRVRRKNCLNCGKLASFFAFNGMKPDVTCWEDGRTISDEHPRREGPDVAGCWCERGSFTPPAPSPS